MIKIIILSLIFSITPKEALRRSEERNKLEAERVCTQIENHLNEFYYGGKAEISFTLRHPHAHKYIKEYFSDNWIVEINKIKKRPI